MSGSMMGVPSVATFPIHSARESGDGRSEMRSERGGGIAKGDVVREALSGVDVLDIRWMVRMVMGVCRRLLLSVEQITMGFS
jgi:hypothetical protein